MKARKRAAEADVIVVNHHLFFADIVLRDEGVADLLPAANTVIFDEAHHLPDIARLFFGQSLSTTQVLELARDARFAEAQHAKEGTQHGRRRHGARERRARPAPFAGPVRGRAAFTALRDRAVFDRALDALAEASRTLTASARRAGGARRGDPQLPLRADEFIARVARLARSR